MGFFRKNPPPKSPILVTEIPRDEERLGPAPPPRRTAHAPGVSVFPFGGPYGNEASFAALGSRPERLPFRTLAGHLAPGEELSALGSEETELAAVILSGVLHGTAGDATAGDVVIGTSETLARSGSRETSGAELLVDLRSPVRPVPEPSRIGPDDLVGRPFRGVTGIRALSRTQGGSVIRLGPPPGARWVLVGLRSLALFSGKLVLIDGEESHNLRAAELAVVHDPTATLYVQAGNDSAVAVGFASPDLVVALG